jgi:hypothetical protein
MPCRPIPAVPVLAALALLGLGARAVAQESTPGSRLSFEASLKQICPEKSLEFLPVDRLAEEVDAFVADLPEPQKSRVADLARPGVSACAGSRDAACRTAAMLGTLRQQDLSLPLAQRACRLRIVCRDFFECQPTTTAQARPAEQSPAPPPTAPPRAAERPDIAAAPAAPSPPANEARRSTGGSEPDRTASAETQAGPEPARVPEMQDQERQPEPGGTPGQEAREKPPTVEPSAPVPPSPRRDHTARSETDDDSASVEAPSPLPAPRRSRRADRQVQPPPRDIEPGPMTDEEQAARRPDDAGPPERPRRGWADEPPARDRYANGDPLEPDDQPDAPLQPYRPGAAIGALTGLDAVTGFYRALGRGDGDVASRFVVPEKRTAGPLSGPAMTRFYSRLARPLRLTGIRQEGPDTFRVSYRFATRAGETCEGDALVRARRGPDGGFLVSGIRALSGC